MEVKVSVDGVPRVVCGVTAATTCQEVVIALAQALGQTGRYTLRETFKDFQRCMAPNERLLETLEKYGEQAREVQLALLHNGPSAWDEMSRTKVGRYQPCPPLRRKDAGGRMRRGSSSLSLHRQSLPPLSGSRQDVDALKEDSKRPKRKSLTLMEEAWEWLEGLGKSRVYSTACDKKTDKKNRSSLDVSLSVDKDSSGRGSRSKGRGQRGPKSDLDHQTSCCMGSQTKGKESKHSKKAQDGSCSGRAAPEDERDSLREMIIRQLSCLQGLQDQIAHIDRQICELEGKQRATDEEQEARRRAADEEMEQVRFWENELKAEEGYERDLQDQFLEMKAKVMECKPKLEEYRRKIQGLECFSTQKLTEEDSEPSAASGIPRESLEWPERDVNTNRKPQHGQTDSRPPQALVPPSQIKERRPTGPTELREWWTRWSEAQSRSQSQSQPQSQSQSKQKVIHRSELTIYLGSTKV